MKGRDPGSLRGRGPTSKKGVALGMVLMLVGTAMLIGFAVVALVSFQMGLGLRQVTAHAAHNAAESVLQVALARIGDSDGDFGKQGTDALRVEAPDGTVGLLTFAAAQTQVVQGRPIAIAPSTHNFSRFELTTGKPGYGRTVPKDSIHLVGTGITPGGAVSRVEALVHFPPFSYALAASGPVHLKGCTIAGIRDPASVPRDSRGSPVVEPSQLSSGDVGANADLRLEKSLVKGDARSTTTVTLLDTEVDGETRQHATDLQLPAFHLDAYDPGAKTIGLELGDTFEQPSLSGNARREGDLHVPGDLVLDNGLLYVTGKLMVDGGIRGRGLVVSQGDLRVAGFSNVAAGESAALLCGGSVSLAGDGVFQGMVYCRGGLKADHVTIVGCLIQDGSAPVEMNDVRLYYTSATAGVSYEQQASYLLDFNCDPNCKPASAVLARLDTGALQKPSVEEPQVSIDAVTGMSSGLQMNSFELTRYCHRHMLVTVTKRHGNYVYTALLRRRHESTICPKGADGKGINDPELVEDRVEQWDDLVERKLEPDSPWESYPQTGMPGGVLSIYEFTNLDDLKKMLSDNAGWVYNLGNGTQTWTRNDWRGDLPAKKPGYDYAVAFASSLCGQIQREVTEVSTQGAAEKINLVVNPSRFLAPYDRMRLLYWGDL